MLLKNTSKFRQAWKTEQGYDMPHWDENFIGATFEQTSGFYKMVNGIVSNIKADLTPKLQNAQDAQAIYEFLQNAADSQATDCAILYDENYFLVVNNGKPFSEADVKAVLNSFQGTKADKTKAKNCEKIGRYGIGFKLVHRLVGKFDGADELLNDLAGPILFSWAKNTQFTDLLNFKNGEQIQTTADFGDKSLGSWLVKIVLSCFPVAPDEKVKTLDFTEKTIFPVEEVHVLADFLRKNESLLSSLNLDRGSLIFLKFGEKKYEKLKESLENLKSGIGYSLNLLKTLRRVVLIDEVIERFPIKSKNFVIPVGSPEFAQIAPEFPFCPIEITVGYETNEQGILRMKDAPSFYQYFPMRAEKHNSAFFVHATSFNKVTDRTHLDDQGESNFATFDFLVNALKNELTDSKKANFTDFAEFYKAFLLSDKPDKYNSQLIGKKLYQPLLEFCKNNIPTVKNNAYAKDLLVVKQTNLPVEPMNFGIAKEWFFWTAESDNFVKKEAMKAEKLGLTAWNLKNLLQEGQINLINEWFLGLTSMQYEIFVQELKQINFSNELLAKFVQIKAFRCLNTQGKAEYFSLEELKSQTDVLLVNHKTKMLATELKSVGFLVLEIEINEFKDLQSALKGRLDYLFDNRALFQKILSRVNGKAFSVAQKHNIFAFFSSLKEITADQLKEISLFANRKDQILPLKNLLAPSVEVESFLESFKIQDVDFAENLLPFMLKKDDIYSAIIYPNWDLFLENENIKTDYLAFSDTVQAYFKLKKGKNLSDKRFVWSEKQQNFVLGTEIFYDPNLKNLSTEKYEILQNAFEKLSDKSNNLSLPSANFLKFFNEEPFKISPSRQGANWAKLLEKIIEKAKENTLNAEEKQEFFKFFRQIGESAITEKIPLFCNELSQPQIPKNLISPDAEVPNWLNGFKIKGSEYKEDLKPYFCRKEDIYANIVFPLWDSIVLQPSVTENVLNFYEEVRNLFAQNRSNKVLTNKKTVFLSKKEGFEKPENVFYKNTALQTKGYQALQRAIWKGTNLKMPDKNVYSFFSENPFKIEENSWQKSWKNDHLNLAEDEAINLLQFAELSKESVFNAFMFSETENEKEYVLQKKGNFLQAFAGKNKQKMHQNIQELFANKYKILPEKLFVQSFENKGLIGENVLAQELLKTASTEALADMMSESTNPTLQAQTLGRMSEILLVEGVFYEKNTPEHQAIMLLKNKEIDANALIPKIFVEDAQGEKMPFSDLLYAPQIAFSIEKLGKFEIELTDILPNFARKFDLLDSICSQFAETESQVLKKKLSAFLGEKDKNWILETLKTDFPNIENSAQLAFLLLFSRISQTPISDFCFQSKAGQTEFSENMILYLNAPDFVLDNAILDAKYESLPHLLRLNSEKHPIFEFEGGQIRLEPFFDKHIFKTSPLSENLIDNSSLQMFFLENIFEKWQEKQSENIEIETENSLKDVLGFVPNQTVENFALSLPEEQMPYFLDEWQKIGNYELKNAFLKALGVHTQSGDLLKIREYFLNNLGEISLKQLREIADRKCLQKTVNLFKINHLQIAEQDEKLAWLKKLYNLFEQAISDLPFISKTDQNDQAIYEIAEAENIEFYSLDDNKLRNLREKYHFPLSKLIPVLAERNIRLTQLDLKICLAQSFKLEENLSYEYLLENSFEWAEEYYEKWKAESGFEIYLHAGQMPYTLAINGQTIQNFVRGNAFLLDKQLFVNTENGNIEENLFGVLPQNSLLLLLRFKNQGETQKMPLSKTENATQTSKKYFALKEALLPDSSYDLSEFLPENAEGAVLKNIKKDEKELWIVLKEIQNQKLRFSKTEMKILANNAELWVFDGEKAYLTSLDEILQSEQESELQLDLKDLGADIWRKLANLL